MKIVILLLILLKHASTNNVWVIEPAVSSSSSSSLPPSSIENQIEQTQQEIEEKVEDYDESFIPKKKEKTVHDKNYDSHSSKDSANNFFITAFNKPDEMATNFTNKFKTPLKLSGTYEICLHQIVFKNTLEIDLGELEIHFSQHIYANKEDVKTIIKIKAHMGDSACEIIKKLNTYLGLAYIEYEYKRRLKARKDLKLNPENYEFFIGAMNPTENIILPVEDNDVYDNMTKIDILKTAPELIFCQNKQAYMTHKDKLSIKLHGNILNFVTINNNAGINISKMKNSTIFTINIEHIPEFTAITLLVDLVEPENYGDESQPVLKIFTLSKQSHTQTKTFKMENSDYKTIKKHPMHNRITHINIKILQENNINFRQSSNIFRFHLRKL